MNNFWLMCFALLLLNSCGTDDAANVEEKFCDCEMLTLDNLQNHFYLDDPKEPYTGICKTFYSNGQIKQERQLVKGKNNGYFKNYSISGVLLEEGGFLDNRHHGRFKYYDDQGKLTLEIEYANGFAVTDKSKK